MKLRKRGAQRAGTSPRATPQGEATAHPSSFRGEELRAPRDGRSPRPHGRRPVPPHPPPRPDQVPSGNPTQRGAQDEVLLVAYSQSPPLTSGRSSPTRSGSHEPSGRGRELPRISSTATYEPPNRRDHARRVTLSCARDSPKARSASANETWPSRYRART